MKSWILIIFLLSPEGKQTSAYVHEYKSIDACYEALLDAGSDNHIQGYCIKQIKKMPPPSGR